MVPLRLPMLSQLHFPASDIRGEGDEEEERIERGTIRVARKEREEKSIHRHQGYGIQ